jgi:nitroreductase
MGIKAFSEILITRPCPMNIMETQDAIKGRRSVRSFDSLPVTDEQVFKIIEAGTMSPSAGNLQDRRFVIVRDRAKKIELAEASLSQMWMTQAPVIIVVCIRMDIMEERYGKRGIENYAYADAALCAQNMMLAAYDMGLDSCYVGSFNESEVSRVVKIPNDVKPIIILPIGKGLEKPPAPTRFDIHTVSYNEEYGKKWVKRWGRLHGA